MINDQADAVRYLKKLMQIAAGSTNTDSWIDPIEEGATLIHTYDQEYIYITRCDLWLFPDLTMVLVEDSQKNEPKNARLIGKFLGGGAIEGVPITAGCGVQPLYK